MSVISSPRQMLFLSGGTNETLKQLSDSPISKPESIEDFCRSSPEVSIIQVLLAGTRPVEIYAWRPVNSKFEICYSVRPDGSVFVSDTMRNAIAMTPQNERSVSEDGMLDHLIFRRVPLGGSLLEGWRRVGPGEKVHIQTDSGSIKNSYFDRVTANVGSFRPDHRLELLDNVLAEIMSPLKRKEHFAALFSGGVDSTLLYTYLETGTPTISALPETLQTYEQDVLDETVALLGISPYFIPVGTSDYLEKLEAGIEEFGLPPELDQIAFYSDLYACPYQDFMSGSVADSLFGSYPMCGWSGLLMLALVQFGGIGLARFASNFAPNRQGDRLREKADWAEEFRFGLMHVDGATALEDSFTNYDLLHRLFGMDAVNNRLETRLNGILPLVEPSAPSQSLFYQHMELLHWIGYIAGGAALQERQQAFGRGKSLHVPFTDRRLMDFVSAIPVKDRYLAKDRQAKPWLKKLLARRLPGYPVTARKGTTQFPIDEFFASGGPLRNVWEKYTMPEPFLSAADADIRHSWSDLNWNVLGYAVWRDRVLQNPSLQLSPGTQFFCYDLDAESTPPTELVPS